MKVRIGFISAISVDVGGVYLVAKTTTGEFFVTLVSVATSAVGCGTICSGCG